MGEMKVMIPFNDPEYPKEAGHIKEVWDSSKPEEVQHAKETYEKFTKKGYLAFRVKKNGDPGDKLSKFDADAEMIILQPMLAGG